MSSVPEPVVENIVRQCPKQCNAPALLLDNSWQ
jgi:hypothetical protein